MNQVINYTPVVVGIWLLISSQIMNTQNTTSAIVFKVIPLILGLASLFSGAKLLQWL